MRIGFLLTLLITLYVSSLRAQVDSNAVVSFDGPEFCGGCTMSISVFDYTTHDSWTESTPASFCLGLNQSKILRDSYLALDTLSRRVDSIVITFGTSTSHDFGTGNPPVPVNNFVTVRLGSLPYSDSNGVLVAHVLYHGSGEVNCFIMSNSGTRYYQGGCTQSESIQDSITIRITPARLLSVKSIEIKLLVLETGNSNV